MKEKIISFHEPDNGEYPFFVEMAGISYCDGSYRIERKNSSIYVFEYIIDGEGTVNINGTVFTASKGDIYILPQGSNHVYYSDSRNPWTKVWVNIRGPLIDSLIQVYRLSNIYHVRNLDLQELFEKMQLTIRTQDVPVKEMFSMASLVFHEILIKISQRVHIEKPLHSPEASRLKSLLDKNIEGSIGIKALGEHIFRSPSQTIRIFKKEFGITPYEYLLTKKIEAAKLLLLNTNMPIKEIAFKLSFADEHYFSNYFKAKTGISPISFRNEGVK